MNTQRWLYSENKSFQASYLTEGQALHATWAINYEHQATELKWTATLYENLYQRWENVVSQLRSENGSTASIPI